ncbi:hypothetical protein Q4577_06130 [Marinovum sp. 2_MG-2023]|uniref:hypothetical protein n=1 Tax=unclassified Marinovum TaxID=2647166 RepID=UPI0026E2CB61|nr:MULTISPECIES: hypothetical protein [unclassified Marinovum]MDO6729588.1 hypothetical protein [Marinovum sp. 2_MG-2023]MDO6780258.1 hypothetical protein [Marinovum sp. 1_MG-2023]
MQFSHQYVFKVCAVSLAMIAADVTISTVTSPAHAMKLFGGKKKNKKKKVPVTAPAGTNAGTGPTEQYSTIPNAPQTVYSSAGLPLQQSTYDVVTQDQLLPLPEDAVTLGDGVRTGAAGTFHQDGQYGTFSTTANPGAGHYEAAEAPIRGQEIAEHHGPMGYENGEIVYGELSPDAGRQIYTKLPPEQRQELIYVDLPPEEELQARAELEATVAEETAIAEETAAAESQAAHEQAVKAEFKANLNKILKKH